jgi:SHS2 domain-containing protein
MDDFEIVEHTADVGIRGRGDSLDALFTSMARGLFAVIADPATVRTDPKAGGGRRSIRLDADSAADLLHDWLDELNALHQIHAELYRRFTVHVTDTSLTAIAEGETIDPDRHDLRVEVKAVTWHDLRLNRTGDGYEAFVLLDI